MARGHNMNFSEGDTMGRFFRCLTALAVGITLLSTVSACKGGSGKEAEMEAYSPNETGKLKIGFSQMENTNPWRIAETNSIVEEAKKRGYDLLCTDAESQAKKQVEDVKYIISRKVDYIILAPREFEGLAPALQAAKKARIPVMLVDRAAYGTPGEDYVTFIGSDFIQQGERAGEWLAKKLGGKGNVINILGTAGSSVAMDRSEGFINAISKYPDIYLVDSPPSDFTRVGGQKILENIIKSSSKKIDGIFAHNDELAIGAIQALKAAGIIPGKDVALVSVDGEKDALKAIIAGELGASIECNPRLGPSVFDAIERHSRGEKLPTKLIIPDRFFDIGNAMQFVDQAY